MRGIVGIQEVFNEFMRVHAVPYIKAVHQPLDDWLRSLPLWVGLVCALSLFILAALWALSFKSATIYQGAPDSSKWRDLRIWTVLTLLLYAVLYLLLWK